MQLRIHSCPPNRPKAAQEPQLSATPSVFGLPKPQGASWALAQFLGKPGQIWPSAALWLAMGFPGAPSSLARKGGGSRGPLSELRAPSFGRKVAAQDHFKQKAAKEAGSIR